MYKNISLKYHRITGTQTRVITKVHDLLGQPSYIYYNRIQNRILLKFFNQQNLKVAYCSFNIGKKYAFLFELCYTNLPPYC